VTECSFVGATGSLLPTEKLTKDHNLSSFDCGKASLNDWLNRFALVNQQRGLH